MSVMNRAAPMLVAIGLLLTGPVIAQDRDVPSALRPYMSAQEFRAAGLHRLSPVELAQFQAWFVRTMREQGQDPMARRERTPESPEEFAAERRRLAQARRQLEQERREFEAMRAEAGAGAGTASTPGEPRDPVQRFGTERSADDLDRLKATVLDDSFRGWDGPTRITLDNGQVWETIGSTRFRTPRALENPQVTIERGFLGGYSLSVDGFNTSVQVRRIE